MSTEKLHAEVNYYAFTIVKPLENGRKMIFQLKCSLQEFSNNTALLKLVDFFNELLMMKNIDILPLMKKYGLELYYED